jgi:hypothetical protein
MACAETPLPLPSLTSTDHMKQTLCYCACPCAVKLARNEPARDLNYFFRCKKVPFNTGTLVSVSVASDLPKCTIFIVKTGFLYAQVPFRTDVTVFCPQITEWISTVIAIGWHNQMWVTLVPLSSFIHTYMLLRYMAATVFSATVVLYAL